MLNRARDFRGPEQTKHAGCSRGDVTLLDDIKRRHVEIVGTRASLFQTPFRQSKCFYLYRFHFQRTGAEGHKCGPTFNPDYYDAVRWVNSSAVESCNAFLVRFKTLGWYSGLDAFMVILASLISGRNSELLRVDDAKFRVACSARWWTPFVQYCLLHI